MIGLIIPALILGMSLGGYLTYSEYCRPNQSVSNPSGQGTPSVPARDYHSEKREYLKRIIRLELRILSGNVEKLEDMHLRDYIKLRDDYDSSGLCIGCEKRSSRLESGSIGELEQVIAKLDRIGKGVL